ncbi:hypothetical protein J3B02_002481 [Coemansia erecta]|nr:hypothetical protein J3B02_002481 [Coemansia erecta]KAJ2888173.1 hypothetical protein FB639_000818 [Coemansia asiatica]
MNPEYRAAARILCTSSAPNVVAEVTRDTLERWTTQLHPQLIHSAVALLRLGQYTVTFRVRASREHKQRQKQYDRGEQIRNVVDGAAHWVATGVCSVLGALSHQQAALSSADELAVEAMLRAAEDTAHGHLVAALALTGGVALALRDEGVGNGAVMEHAAVLFARLVKQAVGTGQGDIVGAALVLTTLVMPNGVARKMLAETPEVARGFIQQLFDSTHHRLFRLDGNGNQPVDSFECLKLIGSLLTAPSSSFASARFAVQHVHLVAVEWLVQLEQHSGQPTTDTQALAVLYLLEPILQRYFVQDFYLQLSNEELLDTWALIVDTMALVHHSTLQRGRQGTEVFQRTSTLAIQFLATLEPRNLVDKAVKALFNEQKCLLFLPTVGIHNVGRERLCTVLFYLDLLEHLAGDLTDDTLRRIVLPLATLFADHRALATAGPDWFESAHAVVLAVLEQSGALNKSHVAMELVPWYSDLIMELYPRRGINSDLLCISYTACIRCLATLSLEAHPMAHQYIRDRLCKLKCRIEETRAQQGSLKERGYLRVGWEIAATRERELLLVLAAQVSVVPLALLPDLLADLHGFLTNEQTLAATKAAVVTEVEQTVLVNCDVARKPALSTWTWQLRNALNKTFVYWNNNKL